MMIPRAALLAGLMLAVSARAETYPTWPVNDDSWMNWPSVSFNDGKKFQGYYCRASECDPAKKGTDIPLYTLTETGKEPYKATIYKLVERSRWNPRYYTDGPYEKVPEVVDSHRTKFSAKLSHWRYDASKGEVFQGGKRFPASNSYGMPGMSETGSVIQVAPALAMADDVSKPGGSGGNGRGGNGHRGGNGSGNGGRHRRPNPDNGRTNPDNGRTNPNPPTDPNKPLALTQQETRWLTLEQRKDAADAAQAAGLRAKVKENLRPDAGAITKWETAVAAKKPADIDAALSGIKMWGGDVKTGVGAKGDNLEIQLSGAEYDALYKKDPKAIDEYNNSRIGLNGGADGAPLIADVYDPVALHQITEAARKKLGAAVPPPANGGQTGDEIKPLTDAEMALLTPDELSQYKGMLKNANTPEGKKALLDLAKQLRDKIAAEGRAPYKAPTDAAGFDGMQDWQKKKFCAELPGIVSASADQATPEINNGRDAKTGLSKTAGQTPKPASTPAGSAPKWAVDACAKYKQDQSYTPAPGQTVGNKPIDVPLGVDKEKPKDEPNPWLKASHMYNGAKGALLGFLVGSLFGPVGMLVGAAAGFGTFYGISKITDQ